MKTKTRSEFFSCLIFFLLNLGGTVAWTRALNAQELTDFTNTSGKFLTRHCADCHTGSDAETNVDLERPVQHLGTPVHMDLMQRALDAVQSGHMPPEEAAALTAEERRAVIDELKTILVHSSTKWRKSWPPSRNRRLTRKEYNYTMQHLFGVDAELSDLLPADALSTEGYRNSIERTDLTWLHLESYLASARRAVQRYVQVVPRTQSQDPDRQASDDRDASLHYAIEFEDLFYSTADRYAGLEQAPQPISHSEMLHRRKLSQSRTTEYTDPLSPRLPGAHSDDEMLRPAIPKLHQQYVAYPERLPAGELIVRVRAAGTADRFGRFPMMRVEAGITLGDGCSMDTRLLGDVEVRATLDQPKTYAFRIRLEDLPAKGDLTSDQWVDRLSIFDLNQIFIANITPDHQAIFERGRGAYATPEAGTQAIAGALKTMRERETNFLYLDRMEIEMLPGVGADNQDYRWRFTEADTKDNKSAFADLESQIADFLRAAFRRPVTRQEIASKIELFEAFCDRGLSPRASLQETLAAVLVSPSFLYQVPQWPHEIELEHRKRHAYNLASRLSFALWMQAPDNQLLDLAEQESLLQESVLRSQVRRLLDEPRSERFLRDFCFQWLRLDKHRNVAVDRESYPAFDNLFADASIEETLAYFVDVFDSDVNALDLLDSDYAIVNDLLAEHYDLPVPLSGRFQKVQLADGTVRGGLLTQASLLTMNSNGMDSHPVRRGVWLLDRLLDMPPPPPPPNVPELTPEDPDFRGLSLKEQIKKHRSPGACQDCHARIDPWGIAFENFDATGKWRDTRPAVNNGDETGDAVQPAKLIDAATVLPDGQSIVDANALKQHLRSQYRGEFAESLTRNLLIYLLGRRLDYLDESEVQRLRDRFIKSDFRMQELITDILRSDLFDPARSSARTPARTPVQHSRHPSHVGAGPAGSND